MRTTSFSPIKNCYISLLLSIFTMVSIYANRFDSSINSDINGGIEFFVFTENNSAGTYWTADTGSFLLSGYDNQIFAPLSVKIRDYCHVDCHGGDNAHATAEANGGVAPYTYLWSNGSTDHKLTGLTAGTYGVTVTDALGAKVSCEVVIKEPEKLTHNIEKLSDASGPGEADGSAKVTPFGGTKPYTYLWDNGETTATATGLTPGTHSVVVTDKNGCTVSCTIYIGMDEPREEEICDGIDNDGDGVVDENFADSDNDGIADCVDDCDDRIDIDGDNIPDCVDDCDDRIDTDGDNIPDCIDDCDDTVDTDGDNIPDCRDDCDDTIDTDGDNIPDCIDDCDDTIDTDGDNIPDCLDDCDDTIDTDGDNIPDCVDDCDDTIDTDGDNIPDCIDDCDDTIDTDGDNIPDCIDDCDDTIDTDGDNIPDCIDDCDDTIDTDGDNIPDCVDDCDDTIDTDGDNIPDCIDDCDDTIDTDGDNIPDCLDDCDDTIDTDGDNIPDCIDDCDDTIDTDGDNIPDCLDDCNDTIDTDGDNIPDCVDDCDDTIDTDGDNIPDCVDDCDDTIDTDGDGISDCDDYEECDGLDNDGDGQIDEGLDCEEVCDGLDNDGDGEIDEGLDCVELCDGVDNDGDGMIDEGYDLDNDGRADCEDDEFDPPSPCGETAYARDPDNARCFQQDGFANWGWTNSITEGNTYRMEMYSGAANCDYVNNGWFIGYATVIYENGKVTVAIQLFPGVTMTEAQVYIGTAMYPEKNGNPTVGPGQYPYKAEDLEGGDRINYTFEPDTVFSGPLYVIVHATTCSAQYANDDKLEVMGTKATVFQNQVQQVLSLDLDIQYESSVNVHFQDLDGRMIKRPAVQRVSPGLNRLNYNLSGLPSRIMLMNIYTEREIIHKKVLYRE
ncbi:SprB repeat-containing protein [Zeaxanthinibacter sp. PT1]|uniref:SprB repeat-containing protein n=1 Tax=Zeaxanthinibacter TaxID=561554 RepID=UPI00234B7255|nr:SprB repeat-containing protein [Zeaxanthinibacter sp. PT1]MDC6352006.1 SprB repeat-containing protein [Zeaxanthinibacter sp. PT1]